MRSLSKIPVKPFVIVLSLLLLMVLAGCKGGATGSLDAEPTNNSNNGGGGGGTNNAPGTLTWDAPTTNTDGLPITGLGGYKIYYGTSSGIYTGVLDVGNITSYTVDNLNLAPNTYYVAITAYDSSGNESDFSNESSTTIP